MKPLNNSAQQRIKASAARAALFFLAVGCSALAEAGTVEEATFIASAQMQVKEGNIEGCGYRLVGIPKDAQTSRSTVLLDVSFNLYSNGLALMKSGAVQTNVKSGTPDQSTNRPIESFWLKTQGEKPSKPLSGKFTQAETKGYLLYGVEVQQVMPYFEAVFEKRQFTLGVRIKGQSIDLIYSGAAVVSDADHAQGSQCLGELAARMDELSKGSK